MSFCYYCFTKTFDFSSETVVARGNKYPEISITGIF